MPPPSFPNLTVLSHPLIQHKLSILRDKHTSTRDFKQLVGEIATLMAYEVTKDLPTAPVEIETPLERTTGRRSRERSSPWCRFSEPASAWWMASPSSSLRPG